MSYFWTFQPFPSWKTGKAQDGVSSESAEIWTLSGSFFLADPVSISFSPSLQFHSNKPSYSKQHWLGNQLTALSVSSYGRHAGLSHLHIRQGPCPVLNFKKAHLCPKGVCNRVKRWASNKLGLTLANLMNLNSICYIYSEKWHVYKDIPTSVIYNCNKVETSQIPIYKEVVKCIMFELQDQNIYSDFKGWDHIYRSGKISIAR